MPTLRDIIDGKTPLSLMGASPLAEHVSQSVQDPVGATRKGFKLLQKRKLKYDQAKEAVKRNLAPVKAVIQHLEDTHDLNDEQQQEPGNNAAMPNKLGQAQPGMGNPAGNPMQAPMAVPIPKPPFPGQAKKSIPTKPAGNMQGASDPMFRTISAAATSELMFVKRSKSVKAACKCKGKCTCKNKGGLTATGTSEGATKAWDTRGRGRAATWDAPAVRAKVGTLAKGTKIAYLAERDRNVQARVIAHVGALTKVRDRDTGRVSTISKHYQVTVL